MDAKHLLDQLVNSTIFRDYARAFSDATGMPLELRTVECGMPDRPVRRHENRFCAMFAAESPTCTACLEVRRRISDPAVPGPQTAICAAGLSEATVPVRVGERLIGFLQTGEVIVGKPSRRQFAKTRKLLRAWGASVNMESLEAAYFQTTAITANRFQSVLGLLAIFAQHLGLLANQLAIRASNSEPTSVIKARKFIREHLEEDLSLGEVARAVNMSTFYFCKTFKKATGLTFTDYLSRSRIEKARQLLANPHARVSEVAFESGFQSLTHFNRTFHRLLGTSPSEYRASLAG